jgi:curved DNA-binding protein
VAYKDYYQVLEIPRTASEDDVKQAYRKLARKYHPDVSKEKDAEQRFKDLNEAHLYDQYGDAWKAAAEGRAPSPGAERAPEDFRAQGFDFDPSEFQGQDFSSIFEQFFGGQVRGGARRGGVRYTDAWPDVGADREATIELPVEEAFRGGERGISLMDPSTGEQRSYNVRIPAGVRSGQRIRLAGQGGRGGDGAGDLYLRVQLRPSEQFRLDGDDVYTPLPVTPWEAALGASVSLPTLDGSVRLKVPAGSSTGRKIRLKSKGYPTADGGRGDLFAELRVEVPSELTAEERELLERWAALSEFNPRQEER